MDGLLSHIALCGTVIPIVVRVGIDYGISTSCIVRYRIDYREGITNLKACES